MKLLTALSKGEEMRANTIVTFFNPEQSVEASSLGGSCKSPEKGKILMEEIVATGLAESFPLHANFPLLSRTDLLRAHTAEYVDAFLAGNRPLCESNGFEWTPEFAQAVLMTNASFFQAVKHAILHPREITLSPTSGFHHARPIEGAGFCTFSGQAVTALKIYAEYGIAGAFIDLDAHFGNSIEDTRSFNSDINKAIPKGCNINPQGNHQEYLAHFRTQLSDLQRKILDYDVGYVVFCHGADSHEDDDRGGQCTTQEWLECSRIFYDWLRNVDLLRGEPLPCCISLFGGYRRDNYMSVIALHLADLAECLKTLAGRSTTTDL